MKVGLMSDDALAPELEISGPGFSYTTLTMDPNEMASWIDGLVSQLESVKSKLRTH